MKALPRAGNPDDPCVLAGDVWNRSADEIERADNIISTGPGLGSASTPGGFSISLTGAPRVIQARITGTNSCGGGFYNGRQFNGFGIVVGGGTGSLSLPLANVDDPGFDDLLIEVPSEAGFSTHPLMPGTNTAALDGTALLYGATTESTPRGVARWQGYTIAPGILFPVALVQTGGTSFTNGAVATFTYTVKDLPGNTLGTGMSPTWARPGWPTNPGSNGTAFWKNDGTFVLYQTDETPITKTCGAP